MHVTVRPSIKTLLFQVSFLLRSEGQVFVRTQEKVTRDTGGTAQPSSLVVLTEGPGSPGCL